MRSNLPSHLDPRHPVLLQEYAVFTPPVHAMAQTIGDWIDQRQPGGYIHGPSRFGKSRGVKWHLKNVLEDRFGKRIPLHIWSRPPDSHLNEKEFWTSLGLAAGFRYASSRATRGDRRRLLTEFLIASAATCGSNFAALLVDEAQAMTFREWDWLLGLQNAMDWEGFRLSVFSIASHQMDFTYELLAKSDHAHVAARFMVSHWPFPGISSAAEIEFVLKGYDQASEWPPQSGTSYLAHFAPEAFARGARLAPSAEILWRVLVSLLPANYKGDTEFPMQHIAWAVEEVLVRAARGDAWDAITTESGWIDALTPTQFTDHMRLISAAVLRKPAVISP
jgi:hypothetical protein